MYKHFLPKLAWQNSMITYYSTKPFHWRNILKMNFYLELRKLNRQRNIKTKALKKKLKIFLPKLFYRKKSTFIKNDYKNICIFMHSQAIGDAIVTSGIIKALRDNGFKVYVIIPPKISFLFIDIIKTDGFFIYQKKILRKPESH